MVFSDSDRAVIEACFREKGWRGARIVKEFPVKKWSRQSVNRLVKKIKDTGSTSRQSGRSRPRTACTDENKDNVEDMIQSQEDLPGTHHPQRKIARELGVSQSSVSRLAHKLKLKAYKQIRFSTRDEKVRNKRKTRCRLLLNRFTAEKVKNIIFTDEKDFTLEVARNWQNDWVYGKWKRDIAPNRLYHEASRFTKKVMVSAGVSWKGKTRIHFIDTERTKVNSESYKNVLEIGLLPDCRWLYLNGDWVFIRKDKWPLQSPDCNPMDYAVWDSLSQKVYAGKQDKFTENELKKQIQKCWKDITLGEIQKTISVWKKRMRTVVAENGGPIDHRLKNCNGLMISHNLSVNFWRPAIQEVLDVSL